VVGFIAGHAGRTSVDGFRWGVEPICRVLTEYGVPIAPSTYYDAIKARRRVSDADLREEQLMLAIARVHHVNYGVYGARKVWLALNREGITVARCTVERLMKVLGLEGARRGRTVRTDPGGGTGQGARDPARRPHAASCWTHHEAGGLSHLSVAPQRRTDQDGSFRVPQVPPGAGRSRKADQCARSVAHTGLRLSVDPAPPSRSRQVAADAGISRRSLAVAIQSAGIVAQSACAGGPGKSTIGRPSIAREAPGNDIRPASPYPVHVG